jgi:hypothetical protein
MGTDAPDERSLRAIDHALSEAFRLLAKAVAELSVAGDYRASLLALTGRLYAVRFRLGDLRLAYTATGADRATGARSEIGGRPRRRRSRR